MSKAAILADLYKKAVQEYTKSPVEWKGLLSCVARFYKRSFDNAVLIYAQKPDATQLGTWDDWHDDRIGRRLNKGAKSIAVIDMRNPSASLKYLYDFMDTNGTEQSFRNFMRYHWELEEQYRPSLMLRFHDKYAVPTTSIETCLYKLVSKRVAQILPKYMENFKVREESSPLYGMPEEAVKAEFTQLVIESVAYTVFSKCGVSTELFEENSFENISRYHTLGMFMALGSCTVSLARPILKEIQQEIEAIKSERSQIYENRTFDEFQLQRGSGRDAVSRTANLREPGDGQNAGGQIREALEGVYDGEPPAPSVGTGGTGQNQRDNPESGRGSGSAQGRTDTGTSGRTADAGHGGYNGESRTHEQPDETGGGNRHERTGDESQVAKQNTERKEPPTDGKKPSVGGFFVVPPKEAQEAAPRNGTPADIPTSLPAEGKEDAVMAETTEQTAPEQTGSVQPTESDFSFQYQLLSRLRSDCDYFLGAGQRNETHLWAGSVQSQISKMRELYDAVPEKPEWLTEQDIERYEKQMAALETEAASVDTAISSEPDSTMPVLDEEEISDLVDVVLCADDVTPDTGEWLRELCDFFQGGHKQATKANALKAFYHNVDTDYITLAGDHLHITGTDTGLDFETEGQLFSFEYGELADHIDRLILHGVYPYSAEDSMLDDYEIPDEADERNGVQDEETEENLAEMEPTFTGGEQTEDITPPAQPENRQITLFDFVPLSDTYEDTGGGDNDNLIDQNTTEPEPLPFQEGDRIYYRDRVYEVLKFLHDGHTVEIGEVSQLQNLAGFKIRERVPVSEIADCKLLKNSYTEGEIAEMVVNAVQSGDNSEETQGTLKAALQVNQANDGYVETIMQDFDTRTRNGGLNYRFSEEHHLYDGGAKTKCRNNIAAIRLLKELQSQGRIATAEEQITLARFVGWGGLANALTPGKPGWESEYEDIKSLLTEEEFQSAQESTLTAYYTEQSVIRHVYHALERFGFRGGNILDPAMGTGNFYSVLPERMENSKLYGVELDTVSGAIARQLYPEAEIQVKGFEQTSYPDHFFDVVIGNIPFNSIRVDDPRYNRHNFRIHDYFLAKSLDQVRPGGIVAVITSKYTMDKANSKVRRYLAQRAELLGAIRLPNNAFKQVAGTEATTDILFLQKREREIVPDEDNSPWISIEETEDGLPLNTYFVEHPEMVLGEMVFDESMFGNEKTTACHPIPGDDLNERLERAVSYLEGEYHEATSEYAEEKGVLKASLPADPAVRNFSFTVVDDAIYFQENSRMYLQDITGRKAERIRGMVEITHAVRALIDFQNQQSGELPTAEYESNLQEHIRRLNTVYDRFVKDYGYLNSYGNVIAFSRDSNAPLLRSIEKESKTEKGVFEKSAMFHKATIKPKTMPKAVFSAEEALKVSLNVKGRVDLAYMSWLYQMPEGRKATPEEIITELGDAIYQDPDEYSGNPLSGWQTAGEYLSGYVKDKLTTAMLRAEEEPERFSRNVEALKTVQPEPLTPQDISFSLGTPWIPLDVYQDFMYETFNTADYNQSGRYAVELEFSKFSSAYFISSKGVEKDSVTVNQTYGTGRMNAYEILEASLNLRFVEVKDRVDYVDENGEDKVKYVLNKKETILAREKQAQIKSEFERWLFADPERGARLTKLYNDKFNNLRPRVYDGSDLAFPDMSEDIALRTHQRDVVAHGLYGDGNLLMAHEVGAGKTYAAIALAYELKRLGKVHKPLFAVPNHLVGQWADAYMELYPNANILVAEKKDFERKNRRRFAGRIAAGDYDAIIMAHSSFELIGLSRERQLAAMQTELDAVTDAISEQKAKSDKDWSLKQMQIFRRNLQFRYDHLFNAEKKDDVINFEELGVDALIVDEAHAYKNNFSYTKMRNVAGVSGASSQRAMDMHQKCQYINEISGGKGVIYLTGTPVSNSMAELYVLQKTLQPQELERRDLLMFDEWAGTYGKVVSSLEIKPEGNGYQMKNRFAQFHNLPELMSMFAMIADIKTADMLDLPTPKLKTGGVQVVKTACTPEQKRIVMELAERAENIRNGNVDSSEDNFLKLTHEARLLSTDPRALDGSLPDDPDTKLNVCARNVAQIYHDTAEQKLTQLIFCDQGTPKYDGTFNFYEATKAALLAQGVKPEEIAFIHDAKTDVQREQLFEKVKNGEIRILMGSTEKMGTGMNVQNKLIALHHLDVPWRPADLTQRNGRILRQGNENEEISIFNYITENTFDAYLWQILEQKQRYISQIMTGRSALRTCEDLDETVLQYAEFKALATSDPRVKEKMEVDNEINRLTVLKSAWQTQQNDLRLNITKHYPDEIAKTTRKIEGMTADLAAYTEKKSAEFQMIIDGKFHEERTKAAEHFMVRSRKLGRETGDTLDMGSYAGFSVRLLRTWGGGVNIQLCGKCTYQTDMGESELGNITRIENLAQRIIERKDEEEQKLESLNRQLAATKAESEKPFADEERLAELQQRKVSLDLALEFKEDGDDVMAEDGGEEETTVQTNDSAAQRHPPTLEQRLYRKLIMFATPVLDGSAYYMKLKSAGFEDLVLEAIGGGEYSIAHYYNQNGAAMRDPEITFTVDTETKSIYPTSFLQDDMGIFYKTETASPSMVKDLKEFMSQWFTNIKNQGFEPETVKLYEQDEEQEYER